MVKELLSGIVSTGVTSGAMTQTPSSPGPADRCDGEQSVMSVSPLVGPGTPLLLCSLPPRMQPGSVLGWAQLQFPLAMCSSPMGAKHPSNPSCSPPPREGEHWDQAVGAETRSNGLRLRGEGRTHPPKRREMLGSQSSQERPGASDSEQSLPQRPAWEEGGENSPSGQPWCSPHISGGKEVFREMQGAWPGGTG